MSETHELHRKRRKPLEPFFSRQGIERIESSVAEETRLLDDRIQALRGSNAVIRLDHAFSAFAGDVIGKICCEEPPKFLEDANFAPYWHNLIDKVVSQILLFMHVPWLIARVDRENSKSSIFRHLISSDLPEPEKSSERFSREAMVLLWAGTATTARTMGFVSYYVLANPRIRERLREELRELTACYPNKVPRWADVEKVPYLQACIKEGLRVSFGVMRRLPRCSPDVVLEYKQYSIPKNTPVDMGAYLMHTDPEVYLEPFKFSPERWLGDYNPLMNRNFVPFSKGSRNCLGINLAYAEMNLALATLLRLGGPDLSLFETDESDVKQAVDFLMPVPKLDTRGTRVMVH
ncbi:Trichodiene oxygenase [Tolypocladium ophioglossoides CBS 100239]|uniref:Trichodiene oxygenase n=1 Tax=Tolypocladium ophioglossoides (strain CBS 100239) TaxID=1163406 RepID=A0A0L0MYJ4_TOLOC|nr:Trichodiene oxygenase [Tolypocladium ophioglossoides CBS 100239]